MKYLFILLFFGMALAQEAPQSRAQIGLSFAPVVKKTANSVVNIYTTRKLVGRDNMPTIFNDPFFSQFFGGQLRQRREESSLGSGVIVHSSGLVVTNHHVINGADIIKIATNDNKEYTATLLAADAKFDLAVLKIQGGNNFTPLPMGDSDAVEIGDLVLAIGNPFGVGQTVTSGIISALARHTDSGSEVQSFIQTDAAINPGNSGGALVGMDGKLIGVNAAIFSQSGGYQGIGFAIPVNLVKKYVENARLGRQFIRPYFGFTAKDVDSNISAALKLDKNNGFIIERIIKNSPAHNAGLQEGDVVQTMNKQPIQDFSEFKFKTATLNIGDNIELMVIRRGRENSIKLTLGTPPENPPRQLTKIIQKSPLQGISFANLSPLVNEENNFPLDAVGVGIIKIDNDSIAERIGFQLGDRIISINNQKTENINQLQNILKSNPNGWVIEIVRGDQILTLQLR